LYTPTEEEAYSTSGWIHGFKLFVGDIPGDLPMKVMEDLAGAYCDMHMMNKGSSGMKCCIITYSTYRRACQAVWDLEHKTLKCGSRVKYLNVHWYGCADRRQSRIRLW